jgi:predicted CoA-substrate-specific enzyme activase
MAREKVIIFPRMGLYSQLLKDAIDAQNLPGVKFVLPPPTTKRTIQIGSRLSEAEMCLPYKITLGNIIETIERYNPDYVGMFDSCGSCRLKIYHIGYQKLLQREGYPQKVLSFTFKHPLRDIKKFSPSISPFKAIKALLNVLKAIRKYDEEQFVPWDGLRPRIGVVGEIYTVLDERANMNLFKKLKELGAYVHNAIPLSHFVLKSIKSFWMKMLIGPCRGDLDQRVFKESLKESYRYLPKYDIGGHGRESIAFTIYFAKKGYDLVLHIYPFPCMPEVTVAQFIDDVGKDYNIPVIHLMFDANFGEANLETRLEAIVSMLSLKKRLQVSQKEGLLNALLKDQKRDGIYLGIDIGSISTKLAIIDGDLKVLEWAYIETQSNPIEALRKLFDRLSERYGGVKIEGVGITGSGRKLGAALVGADVVVDEITAQTLGCLCHEPAVRTIIEIGGQDSKYIEIDQSGLPRYFNLNNICSAGTGSFFSGTSRRLGIPIERFGEIALGCPEESHISGRCSVFAESDLISKQQAGVSKEALIRGLCMSMPLNYLSTVAKNRKIIGPVVFTGGVASNKAVVEGFRRILGMELKVPRYNKITGCIGAAIMAIASPKRGNFLGFEITRQSYIQKLIYCQDCPNRCEISLIYSDSRPLAAFGSWCGKWENLSRREYLHEL